MLCGVADEVLAIMKSNDQILMTSNIKKKLEIEKLIGQQNVVNDADDDVEFYQPKNEDTWYAYNMLIAEIVQHVDDKVAAHKVILGVVADRILSALSNEENSNWLKKTIIEGNLGPISWETFDQLVFISKLIHDYHSIPDMKTEEPAYRLSLPSTSGTSTSVDDDKHVDLKPVVFIGPKPKLELLNEEEVEYEYIGEDGPKPKLELLNEEEVEYEYIGEDGTKPKLELLSEEEVEYEYIGEDGDDEHEEEERIVEDADCHQVKQEEVVAKEQSNVKRLKRSGLKLSFLDEEEEIFFDSNEEIEQENFGGDKADQREASIERTFKDAGCHHVKEEEEVPKEQFKVASPKRTAEDCESSEDPESCQGKKKKKLKVMSLR
ncbi:uncharacterized protein LOC113350639 [Papaver somniferum]|uniref:uncharacterized protein LOC113350639 n=1 Tax=Papaver somniferum TaxID=3469 RepID=UPI000E6FE5A8|nr:uncharacterized protein LOC113350639 [Papaver somniferum]